MHKLILVQSYILSFDTSEVIKNFLKKKEKEVS